MSKLAQTLLTADEIDVLAQGLAKLVDSSATPANAHEASGVVHRNARSSEYGNKLRSLATHLAELSYEVER